LVGAASAGAVLCVRGSLFFFFQAEDGIRDWSVTGVQTCALPISYAPAAPLVAWMVLAANASNPSRRPASGHCATSLGAIQVSVEIGRASCRERGEISVGGGCLTKTIRAGRGRCGWVMGWV